MIINFLDTNTDNKNIQNSQIKSNIYLEFLNSKIEKLEDKLSDLIFRRDKVSTMQQAEKDDLFKALEENLESENFEEVQENYINNRRKRISETSSRKNSYSYPNNNNTNNINITNSILPNNFTESYEGTYSINK
jgi:hypothetical protein